MKWYHLILVVTLSSCSNSRIRFVKAERIPTNEVHHSGSSGNESLIGFHKENDIEDSKEASPVVETNDLLTDVNEPELRIENSGNYLSDLSIELDLKSEAEPIRREEKKDIDPKKELETATILIAISMMLVIIAIAMVLTMLVANIGMPTIYFFLMSLVFYVIGTTKSNRGYRAIMSDDSVQEREQLYQTYKSGKTMRRVTEILMSLWLLAFLIFLLIPVIKAAGELGFLLSGGLKFSL